LVAGEIMSKVIALYVCVLALIVASWQCFAQLATTHDGAGASASAPSVGVNAVGNGEQHALSPARSPFNFANLTIADGNNRALLAFIGLGIASADPTVTWNGALMTKITSSTAAGGVIYLYGLVNPAAGNSALAVSFSQTTEIVVDAIAFNNVDQTGGAVTFPSFTNSGSGSSATLTTTNTSRDMAVAMFQAGSSLLSANQTQVFLSNALVYSSGGQYSASNGGSPTFTYEVGGGPWAAIGATVKAH
jgi:hypothetical protein